MLQNVPLLALLCLALLCGAALAEADQARCGKNIRKGYTLYGSKGEIKTVRWPKNSRWGWGGCSWHAIHVPAGQPALYPAAGIERLPS